MVTSDEFTEQVVFAICSVFCCDFAIEYLSPEFSYMCQKYVNLIFCSGVVFIVFVYGDFAYESSQYPRCQFFNVDVFVCQGYESFNIAFLSFNCIYLILQFGYLCFQFMQFSCIAVGQKSVLVIGNFAECVILIQLSEYYIQLVLTKHTEDNVGLFNTVITRDDYNAMSGQLADSMVADEVVDIPEPEPVKTVSKPEKEKPAKKKQPVIKAKEVKTPTRVNPTSNFNRFAKKKIQVDLSAVKVGVRVKHKAFGEGTVTSIYNGSIKVEFNGLEKQFIYPASFEQGFLIC